ncbi:MAG TPA: exodeoxyribonuclease VII large subunit, partial [Candidatus Sericytochromatia bacterium]
QQQRLGDRLSKLRLDRKLQQERQRLDWMRKRLMQGSALQIQQANQHCQSLQQKLATLDPAAVLKRGYAVVRANGTIVRTAEAVAPGQTLNLQLGQGQVTVQVTAVLPQASENE